MAGHDIIVIGGSAGGYDAMRKIAARLPADIAAAILVVIHLNSDASGQFAEMLGGGGPLRAHFAEDGETVRNSRIYVAPPDRHLLIYGDRLRLGQGLSENRSRPAIDPLFRSAAVCCGPRVIGVLLSGNQDDGSSGLIAVKQGGGITVVQDPANAEFPGMPRHAVRHAPVDHLTTLDALPDLLVQLSGRPAMSNNVPLDNLRLEVDIAAGDAGLEAWEKLGSTAVLSCPECHGTLKEITEGALVRYRCHTGHAYSASSLNGALDGDLSRALISALRALQEKELLMRRLAGSAEAPSLKSRWESRAAEYQEQAETVRRAVRQWRPAVSDPAKDDEVSDT